jgi:beta-lactamase superfamily II metal-dependent hydrolase
MSDKFVLPKKGFVFWPVGTGDSTTTVVKENEIVVQIDLHHMQKADGSDDPAWPIIDELVRLLPKKNGKPYLSVFMLTHPDEDHILGFAELLKKVTIGEIWHTPRIFRDYEDEVPLCEDAKVFRKEADRRRKAIIDNPGNVKAGDRVRVIGHDDILNEDRYKDFPRERTSMPGTLVTVLDDENVADDCEIFVHAPFKVDAEDTRNNTSLSIQMALKEGTQTGKAFFFGDREYPTLKQIFEVTIAHDREEYLYWDVLLSPHHCSKKAMFWKDEGEEEESFKKDIMDYFEKYERAEAYIIASANSDFTDKDGDNPPHGKARKEYEKIVDAGHFLCTHERPSKEAPEPVKFELTDKGFHLVEMLKSEKKAASALSIAVDTARGGTAPPQQQVGFGRK